jgi:hypothetical protein
MRATRARLALFVVTAATTACIREYHPEYRPETSYKVVQNVSYPTTVVTVVEAPPSAPPSPGARRVGRAPDARADVIVPTQSVPRSPPLPSTPDAQPPATGLRETGLPRSYAPPPAPAPPRDLERDRARCRAGDAPSCRALPGIHLSGNVVIHGNVTMFGDVYMNDSVAASRPPWSG